MKAVIEWKDLESKDVNVWLQSNVELKTSKIGNLFFKHDGILYVLAALKEGVEVVSKIGQGPWIKRAGRVCRNNVIYLGEGKSHAETTTENFANQRWERPIFG